MEGGKKIVVIVILLAVVVAAGTFLVMRMGFGKSKPPDSVLGRPVERIDSESLELMTRSRGEWEKLGHKDGKYKNPDTGKYTMVLPAICAVCGEKIPAPDMTVSTKPGGEPIEHLEALRKREARIREWKCPRCRGYAAPSGMPIMPDDLGPRGPSPRPK